MFRVCGDLPHIIVLSCITLIFLTKLFSCLKTSLVLFEQENAEVAVRDMLREIAVKTKEQTGKTVLIAEDFMDEGTKICLEITIDEHNVHFFFSF